MDHWILYYFMLNMNCNYDVVICCHCYHYPLFQGWEHLLLMRLKWDLSAITPIDFLEQILSRLPDFQSQLNTCKPAQALLVKRHAKTFIALCATGMSYNVL